MMKYLLFLLFSFTIYGQQKPVDVTQIDRNMTVKKVNDKGIKWYSPKEQPFRLLGFKFIDQDKIYRRLPLKAHVTIPPKVNVLANQTSGGQIHFKTNSKRLMIRVKVSKGRPMYHMTQVAKQGFDLYIGSGKEKKFVTSAKFEYSANEYTASLYYNRNREMMEFTLNFPLYNGVESVEIGVDEKALVEAPSALASDKSIVIYGTSITHGGCATRPGMSYPNILSRRLNNEVVNWGFSGSGKGEPEIAELISLIKNKSLVVLDFECNTHEQLRVVLKPFIETLRKRDAVIPILVVSRIPLTRDLKADALKKRQSLRDFQSKLVSEFKSAGDENIYFLDGIELLDPRWANEATVDGTHPTDLGFLMMAEAMEPHIRKITGLK